MKNKAETALLGFGSNVGDGPGNLRAALRALERAGVELARLSSIYVTSPVGPQEQNRFTNAAALARTTLGPHDLLSLCKETEFSMGREQNGPRWGPRIIDIDILFFGRLVISDPDLRIPHPEIGNRLFVLAPLLEIAPDFIMPDGAMFSSFAHPKIAALHGSGQEITRIGGDIFS